MRIWELTHVKTHKFWQICSRLVAMLFQQLVNRMCSHCLFPACWQVVNNLLTTCYKVVELNWLVTSCSKNLLSSYNSTICQQVASDNLVQLDKITALLQLVDKLAASLLRTHLLLRSCEIFTCAFHKSSVFLIHDSWKVDVIIQNIRNLI
jgi:hypothetical protein